MEAGMSRLCLLGGPAAKFHLARYGYIPDQHDGVMLCHSPCLTEDWQAYPGWHRSWGSDRRFHHPSFVVRMSQPEQSALCSSRLWQGVRLSRIPAGQLLNQRFAGTGGARERTDSLALPDSAAGKEDSNNRARSSNLNSVFNVSVQSIQA